MVVHTVNRKSVNHEWLTIEFYATYCSHGQRHRLTHICSDPNKTIFISSLTISLLLSCPPARHEDIVVAAEAGPSRDPRVEERHHGERRCHHRAGWRPGMEPHRHLPQLCKCITIATGRSTTTTLFGCFRGNNDPQPGERLSGVTVTGACRATNECM